MRAVGKSTFGGRLDGRTFEKTKPGSTQFSLYFACVFGVNTLIAQAFGIGRH